MEGKCDFSSLKDWRVSAVAGVVAGFVAGLLIFGWPAHLPPAWGDIPAWIGAIATIGLLIGAIYTARYAIKAFGTQSEQLEEQRKINTEQTAVLKLQAKELRESIDERRRAQVSRIVISAEPKPLEDKPIRSIEVTVHNTSQQAIYDLKLLWPTQPPDRHRATQPPSPRQPIQTIPSRTPPAAGGNFSGPVTRHPGVGQQRRAE